MTLDIDFVRRPFPALSGAWVVRDNAGGSQVLSRVATRISDYLLTSNVQTGASYEPSQRSTERVREARPLQSCHSKRLPKIAPRALRLDVRCRSASTRRRS